ncbi:MAG: alpha,alpha-trehalose-phosphate synthase (UDP-forming) [Actinomycetota bacterium]
MEDDVSIVLASNRGPVSFVKTAEGFEPTRGAGGLAGALDWVARELGDRAIWIAAATSDDDREALAAGDAETTRELLGYPVRMLDFDPETYERYYNGVSNRMLWFANHCLWDELGGDPEFQSSNWSAAYEPVNVRFADEIIDSAADDALVLFQDYHLATAPGHLRERGDEHSILHFTHSSFCGPQGLERLPAPIPRGVTEGMLGADLLGFHVPRWADGFLRCCERIGAEVDRAAGIVHHEGRRTWVRSYPIPIDPTDLRERAAGVSARRWADRFRASAENLVVRADRAEPSKNIVRGFEAFGRLLDRRPDLRDNTKFIACLYPSRESMTEYRRYAEQIRAVVAEVNSRHPDSIDLYYEDDFDRTLGAYLVYDVLLVNPIMDGMNLVSKEGPALNERSGALVLSTGAGSHYELGDLSVTISDPLDIEATTTALESALELDPSERERRARELKGVIGARLPEDWIQAQLDDLTSIARGDPPHSDSPFA